MKPQNAITVTVSRASILEGVNFNHSGVTYRADLKAPDDNGFFYAKATNKGREMVGNWILFQQKK